MPELDVISPVEGQPSDVEAAPEEGIALCLSGGGYRAMLFHLGSLWRLNEAGYLPRLDRISSVSGGSIAAGVLALAWAGLDFDERGVGRGFGRGVVAPLRRLAGRTIDVPGVILGVLAPGSIGERVAGAYRRHLFGRRTLQDLPDPPAPRFVFNAANLQSGALWRFSKPYMRDYLVGEVKSPTIEVAVAVAASSAFPPFLSPTVLTLRDDQFTPGSGRRLQRPPYTTSVYLTDGGVYDNLGIETVWKRYRTVLVSDGGGKMAEEPVPTTDWIRQTRRVLDVIDNQVRSLRSRQVMASYRLPASDRDHREGAYWGIRSDIADFGLPDALPCPHDRTLELAGEPTRLARLSAITQERLINWGYAACDAALRRHFDPSVPRPPDFPYPSARVG